MTQTQKHLTKERKMTSETEFEVQAKIASMELLMQRGYISLAKFLEFVRRVKNEHKQRS